jgi:Indole-3-glycerol phosphate synthase
MIEEIVRKKRQQVEQEKLIAGIDDLCQKILKMPQTNKSFARAISKQNEFCIIGEVKKASPSKGVIKSEFDYMEIAKMYSQANIDAVSVLTERYYFQGSDKYLYDIAREYNYPVLRKDFIIDPFQIYQAKLLGASAILLIVSILSDEELLKFRIIAEILGMDCLVEVHDREELERAVNAGSKIIGINNRNLKTFEVSLKTTEELIKYIPENVAVVSESGIRNTEDLLYVKDLGVNAVLIGEMFMRAESIVQEVCKLKGMVKV